MARPIDGDWLYGKIEARYRVSTGIEHIFDRYFLDLICAAPTLTPPNELLTLDQLREMDGEPVWVELYRAWALVEVKQNGSIMFYGNSFSCPYSRTWKVYPFRPDRRPPEGES